MTKKISLLFLLIVPFAVTATEFFYDDGVRSTGIRGNSYISQVRFEDGRSQVQIRGYFVRDLTNPAVGVYTGLSCSSSRKKKIKIRVNNKNIPAIQACGQGQYVWIPNGFHAQQQVLNEFGINNEVTIQGVTFKTDGASMYIRSHQ